MDTSQPRPRAGKQPTSKDLLAGQERKGRDDDLNGLQFRQKLGLMDAQISPDQDRKSSIAIVVQVVNDLVLVQELAVGYLIMYKVTHVG